MKYFYTLLLGLLVLPNLVLAQQNLVPNWSFEDTIQCPIFANANLCVGWSSYGLSPDYYNPCANGISCCAGVPNNWMGYQQPYEGQAYIGLLTYGSGGQNPIREFAGAKLTEALIPGTQYYISAYVSKSGEFTSKCSSNKIGVRFSNRSYSNNDFPPIDNFAHVHSNLVISDTLNWTKIQGSFVADSAFEYIILGNFFDDLATTITDCNTSQSVGAYYYIDKVCVSTDSLTCEITMGISSPILKPAISVSPNPAQDFLNINILDLSGPYDVSIFDMQGREVLSKQNITTLQTSIKINHLESGLLFIKVAHNNQSYIFKILKQ